MSIFDDAKRHSRMLYMAWPDRMEEHMELRQAQMALMIRGFHHLYKNIWKDANGQRAFIYRKFDIIKKPNGEKIYDLLGWHVTYGEHLSEPRKIQMRTVHPK